MTVGAISFAFLVVGFGAVGVKLLRMPDDEWDLLSRAAGSAEPPPGQAT